MKREENFSEMKSFYSKCLAKDIKLSSFLGGSLSKNNFDSLIDVDYFYEFDVLVFIFIEILL